MDALQLPSTKTSTRLTAQWWPSADAWRYGEVGTEAQVRSSFGYCAPLPFLPRIPYCCCVLIRFSLHVSFFFVSFILSPRCTCVAHPAVSSDFLPRIGTGKVIIKPNIKRLVPRSDVRTV